MNFNTTNNTFRQLMGNGLSYRVPLFQRDYSWGSDEWDDLWQDIVALFEADPEPAHYMGCLVLQSADNRAFDVIDGQQRMTTLSLLMLAAVSTCPTWRPRMIPATRKRGVPNSFARATSATWIRSAWCRVRSSRSTATTTASTRITWCPWSGCRSAD